MKFEVHYTAGQGSAKDQNHIRFSRSFFVLFLFITHMVFKNHEKALEIDHREGDLFDCCNRHRSNRNPSSTKNLNINKINIH